MRPSVCIGLTTTGAALFPTYLKFTELTGISPSQMNWTGDVSEESSCGLREA